MKKFSYAFLFLLLTSFSMPLKAQTEVFEFLKGGMGDGEKLFEAYFQPYGAVLGSNLNAGWFNTAKTHGLGGFDLTLTASAAMVPKSDQTFDLSHLNFENLELVDTTEFLAPTIAGADSKGPFLAWRATNPITLEDTLISLFQAPKGTGYRAFGLPMVKAAVGLPFGFEIMGRYMPPLKIGNDMKMDMWGIGLKHDLWQYLPLVDNLPFINLSAMAAYTQITSRAKINFPVYGNPDVQPTATFDNQELLVACKGLTGNILLSFDFPIISVYGGFGFSKATTTVKASGDYPITMLQADPQKPNFGKTVAEVITDPVDAEVNSNDGGRYTGGLKFKLGLLTLHAEYTHAKYPVISTGIGLSFR